MKSFSTKKKLFSLFLSHDSSSKGMRYYVALTYWCSKTLKHIIFIFHVLASCWLPPGHWYCSNIIIASLSLSTLPLPFIENFLFKQKSRIEIRKPQECIFICTIVNIYKWQIQILPQHSNEILWEEEEGEAQPQLEAHQRRRCWWLLWGQSKNCLYFPRMRNKNRIFCAVCVHLASLDLP